LFVLDAKQYSITVKVGFVPIVLCFAQIFALKYHPKDILCDTNFLLWTNLTLNVAFKIKQLDIQRIAKLKI